LFAQHLVLNKPENVQHKLIDIKTGLLGGEECLETVVLPFIVRYAPMEAAPCAMDDEEIGSETKDWFKRLLQ